MWSVGEYKEFSSSTACIFVFCPRVSNCGRLSEDIQCFRLVLHVFFVFCPRVGKFGCLSESIQCFCPVLRVFLSSVRVLITLVVCRRACSVFV